MPDTIWIDGEEYTIGEEFLVNVKTDERISLYGDDGDALLTEEEMILEGVRV